MSKEKNEAILDFPEKVPASGVSTYETDKLIHDTKMAWVRPLNQAAAGLCKISEKGKETLRRLNWYCQEYGHSLLLTDEEIDKL